MHWPEDLSIREPKITPRDAFGNKLEALDALRMQIEVYIRLLPSQNGSWQIEIVGHHPINVEDAEDRLRTMIDRVRADASGIQLTHNIILDEREGMIVELMQDEPWWPSHDHPIVPHLLSSAMMDDPGEYRREGLHFNQLALLKNYLELALENVRYRKGSYDFVVRLGCIALSSKHVEADKVGQTFPRDTFLKDIDSSIELDVKKW